MMKKEGFIKFLEISFLFCLGILAFGQIFSSPIFGFDILRYDFGAKIIHHISTIQYGIVVFAVVCGGLLFYANKDKIERIEEEQEKENNENKKTTTKVIHFSIIFLIIIIGFIIQLIHIDLVPFWFDEFLHITTIHGLENGFTPAFESGFQYLRSFPTTYLVYFMSLFFPVNEYFSRLPFIFLSSINLFLLYLLIKKITSVKISLFIVFILSIYTPFIVISQEVRYYGVLIFITLLFFLVLFSKIKTLYKVPALLMLLYLGLNSSALFLGIFIISLFLYFVKFNTLKSIKENKFFLIFFSIVFIYGVSLIIYESQKFNYFNQGDLLTINTIYLSSYGNILLIFIILGIIGLFFHYKKSSYIALLSSICVILILSIIKTKFSGALRHTVFLIPIIFIFIGLFLQIYKQINIKNFYIIIILISLVQITELIFFLKDKDNFLMIKQQYTWARPDYNLYKKIKITNQDIIITPFPFILNYYTKKVDYALYKEEAYLLDNFLYSAEKDYYLHKPVLHSLKELEKVINNKCIYIFTDYKSDYLFNDEIKLFIHNNFSSLSSRQVNIYYSALCNIESGY